MVAQVLGLLGALYSTIFYVGPYRWLTELQLRWFERYYTSTTVAFTVLLCVVPPLVAIRVLAASGALPADSFAVAMASQSGRGAFKARFARARRWVIVFGVGATLAVLSTRDLVVAARGKQLAQISAQALERGKEPESTWLEVQGNPLWDSTLNTEEGHKKLRYVPVVSDAWSPGSKVRALLRFSEYVADPAEGQPLQGTVDITGVPGLVQSSYAEAELDVRDAVLVDVGESPDRKAGAARFLIWLGVLLMSIGGPMSFVRMR